MGLFGFGSRPKRGNRFDNVEQRIRDRCNRALDALDKRKATSGRRSRTDWKAAEARIRASCDGALNRVDVARIRGTSSASLRAASRAAGRVQAAQTKLLSRAERKERAIDAWEAKYGKPHPSRRNPAAKVHRNPDGAGKFLLGVGAGMLALDVAQRLLCGWATAELTEHGYTIQPERITAPDGTSVLP